jgi:hypothetical protein
MAADLLRPQPGAATHEQGADSFRSVNFVSRKSQQVTAKRVNVDRNSAGGLHRIRVKSKVTMIALTCLVYESADFGYGLYRPYFIICQHHANQNRFRPNRLAHIFDAHYAVVINGQPRNFPASLFK